MVEVVEVVVEEEGGGGTKCTTLSCAQAMRRTSNGPPHLYNWQKNRIARQAIRQGYHNSPHNYADGTTVAAAFAQKHNFLAYVTDAAWPYFGRMTQEERRFAIRVVTYWLEHRAAAEGISQASGGGGGGGGRVALSQQEDITNGHGNNIESILLYDESNFPAPPQGVAFASSCTATFYRSAANKTTSGRGLVQETPTNDIGARRAFSNQDTVRGHSSDDDARTPSTSPPDLLNNKKTTAAIPITDRRVYKATTDANRLVAGRSYRKVAFKLGHGFRTSSPALPFPLDRA